MFWPFTSALCHDDFLAGSITLRSSSSFHCDLRPYLRPAYIIMRCLQQQQIVHDEVAYVFSGSAAFLLRRQDMQLYQRYK